MTKAVLELEFRDKVTAGLKNVEGQLRQLSQTANSIKFTSLITGVNQGIEVTRRIVSVISSFVAEAKESETANIQLSAALRNHLGMTERQVEAYKEYIDVLAKKIGVDDDELARLHALALSLGVQGTHLERLTYAAKALSLATGQDLQSAFTVLIKAAEGQVHSLRRLGIQLDENKIKTQGMSYVLDEVQKKFTFLNDYLNSSSNQVDSLSVSLSQLKEQFGTAILQGLKGPLTSIQGAIENLQGMIDTLVRATSYAGSVLGGFFRWVVFVVVMAVRTIWDALETVVSVLSAIAASVERILARDLKGAALVWDAWLDDIKEKWTKFVKDFEKFSIETTFNVKIHPPITPPIEKNKPPTGEQEKQEQQEKERRKVKEKSSIKPVTLSKEDIFTISQYINSVSIQFNEVASKTYAVSTDIQAVVEKSSEWLSQLQEGNTRIDEMYQATRAVADTMLSWTHYIAGFTNQLLTAIIEGRNLGAAIQEIGRRLLEMAVQATVLATIFSVINSLGGGTPVPFWKAFGYFMGMPVGMFQEGGYVDRPTLALIGEKEPEVVIPVSKFPQPRVQVVVHNATPATYVEVFTTLDTTSKRRIREILNHA